MPMGIPIQIALPVSTAIPIPMTLPPVPMAIPISSNLLLSESLSKDQCELNSLGNDQERSVSEPLSIGGRSSIKLSDRCVSVPSSNSSSNAQSDQNSAMDVIIVSDDDSKLSRPSASVAQISIPTLKRKRSLIPCNIEVENTRKTMKPGPKSKTRNIVTVHQMITEAKMLISASLNSGETSHENSDDSEDEKEQNVGEEESCDKEAKNKQRQDNSSNEALGVEKYSCVTNQVLRVLNNEHDNEIISLVSTDDETDDLNINENIVPENIIEVTIDNSKITDSSDVFEIANSSDSNNVNIEDASFKILNDGINENAIDSNDMATDQSSDNRVLENDEIDTNEILKDEKPNNEVENNVIDQNLDETEDKELKNYEIDPNEELKDGE